MASQFRIDLDRDMCQGHGVCVIHAAQLFDFADDDFGMVLQEVVAEGSDDLADARTAAQKCPERAITLAEVE